MRWAHETGQALACLSRSGDAADGGVIAALTMAVIAIERRLEARKT